MWLYQFNKRSVLLAAGVLFCIALHAQTDTAVTDSSVGTSKAVQVYNLPDKSLRFIQTKYEHLANAVDKQTEKVLLRMQRREAKLQEKMNGLDSNKAKQLFEGTQAKYQQLQTKLQAPVPLSVAHPLEEYIPNIDSIGTSFQFLSKAGTLPGISPDKLAKITAVSSQVQQLQGKLQAANEVQQYIRDREAYLKQQLQNTPLAKMVTGINKEAYYYQQRLTEYKALLNDPQKLGEKVLATVSTMPAFQKFFQKNSYLAQLFRMPGTDISTDAIAGLQTRAGVQNILSQRIGAGTGATNMSPEQYLSQQVQTAQSQVQGIKDKLNQLVGGGNSDMTMPNFKPNTQHTKTFFQRLQYAFNIQSTHGTGVLPATSDLALAVGYKLSDNKMIGVGASYNVGLGHGFNHLKLTNEGVGLRSFADIKLKGSFWLTGGWEYTYYQSFVKFSDIRNLDIWQKSALLGLSRKYSIGKNREGNVQLLYDFLAAKQLPQAQALKFRLGYTF